MGCGPVNGPTMTTSPEIEIHHFDIVPSFKNNEYFINTHGCGNTGNCRASFPEGRGFRRKLVYCSLKALNARIYYPEKTRFLKVDSFFTKKKENLDFFKHGFSQKIAR